MDKCEACEETEQMIELKDINRWGHHEKSYKICANCLLNLVNLSLTKKQYNNLIKNGHEMSEFYLHDDFYDEDGTALQPKFKVD